MSIMNLHVLHSRCKRMHVCVRVCAAVVINNEAVREVTSVDGP